MEAVVATNISKVFRLHEDRPASIKEHILKFGRNPKRDFHALRPLDLTVPMGQTLGILGHNGSGKSTLLKCISGILKPTSGTIQLRGRLASLLELGAGFHPELTGRENVYINAAFLGIKRSEIEKRFDDIVEFAELGQFIDEPVKHYSSGMYVRLGFAVAVNLDPDVLLVDEVLAVGDEVFQRKCLDRIRQFQEEGRTILVVTHAADLVRQVCHRAIVLHHGEMVADAAPGEAIQIFREHLQGQLVDQEAETAVHSGLRVTGVTARRPDGASQILPGDALSLAVQYEADHDFDAVTLSFVVRSAASQEVFALDVDLAALGGGPLRRHGTVHIPLESVPLLDGRYTVSAILIDRHHPVPTREASTTFDVLNTSEARGVAALTVGHVTLD